MKCTYPNCNNTAEHIPVILIPTIRTVGESSEMVQTPRKTMLIGTELCLKHVASYRITEHFGTTDWNRVKEEARAHGVQLDANVEVVFEPLGWTPDVRYLEVGR